MARIEVPSASFSAHSGSSRSFGRALIAGAAYRLGAWAATPRHNAIGQTSSSAQPAVPTTARRLASQGGAWGACSPSSSQCTNFVSESGTVDVLALVNGDTLRATVAVRVVPCPTGDSLLDDPFTRKMLDSLWRLSWPDTTTTANRVERGGYIYYDSTSKQMVFSISRPSPNDNACRSYLGPPPPGVQVVRIIHTHPARVHKYVQCDSSSGHTYADQFGKPSGDDWAFAKQANDVTPGGGVEGWIIDQDEVISFNPAGVIIDRVPQLRGDTASVPRNWRSQPRHYYPRRQPGCTLP
jgi:hypothetical protein